MIKIIIIILIVAVLLFVHFRAKDNSQHVHTSKYKGLCLFDVDGTLSTGQDNYAVVQTCIDAGFAVGVSTAGMVWMPDTLIKQKWFPSNLYDFMLKRNFDTFNNVAGYYLMGKKDSQAFLDVNKRLPPNINVAGWRKGFVMEQNAKMLGITNPKCIIMFDDQSSFIEGILAYNKNYNTACSGENCGGNLSVTSTKLTIKKCG
jgi:hypothetical protein